MAAATLAWTCHPESLSNSPRKLGNPGERVGEQRLTRSWTWFALISHYSSFCLACWLATYIRLVGSGAKRSPEAEIANMLPRPQALPIGRTILVVVHRCQVFRRRSMGMNIRCSPVLCQFFLAGERRSSGRQTDGPVWVGWDRTGLIIVTLSVGTDLALVHILAGLPLFQRLFA